MDLDGETVAITGASGGIGEAIARDLRAQGCRLVLTARDGDRLGVLCAEFGEAVCLAGDVTDAAPPGRLLDLGVRRFGQVDVLINDADVMSVGTVEETDIEAVCAMARIDFEAVVRFAYTFLRPMEARGSGFLVNTSSVAGTMIPPNGGVYAGAKHAVEAFTEALWGELAGSGVGAAVIGPGTVAAGLYRGCDRAKSDRVNSQGALRPADIAAASDSS